MMYGSFKNALFAGMALLLFPALSSCLGSCGHYPDKELLSKDGILSIASWNVQALFDGEDAGTEYAEYRKGSGWNASKYQARLNTLSLAITGMCENGPDIIALVELENGGVLDALCGESLKKADYRHRFFAGNTGYALGVGLLSRYEITRQMVHSRNNNGLILPRPVAEVWLEPGGAPLVLFICHWKSKLGGEEVTEELRREAAYVIIRRCAEIRREYPFAPVVVLGDLNENHDEFYRRGASSVCALMPDDPAAARLAGFLLEEKPSSNPAEEEDADESGGGVIITFVEKSPRDFFVVSDEKPPRSAFFPYAESVFYSPWHGEIDNGSYRYDGEWETIDHFLLSPAFWLNQGWRFQNAAVLDVEPFVNSKGEPATYNPRTGSGLSDHLPLLLTLRLN